MDIGHYLLHRLAQKKLAISGSSGTIIVRSLIVSTRPGALYRAPAQKELPLDKLETLPVLDSYKGITFSPLSDKAASDYLEYLFKCTHSLPTVANIHLKIKSIMSSISGQKSPLMLLLAFAAQLQATSDAHLSRFLLYSRICSASCQRKLKDCLEISPTRDELASVDWQLEQHQRLAGRLERLLTCYAVAVRMLPFSTLAKCQCSLEAQMSLLFGPEAGPELEKDAKELLSALGIEIVSSEVPCFSFLLQKVYFSIFRPRILIFFTL